MGKSAPCSSQGLVLFADTFQFLAFLGRQWQLREEIKPHRISRLRTRRHFDLHIEARPLEQGREATSDQGIRAGAVKSIQPKPSGNDRLGVLEHPPVVGLDQGERSAGPKHPMNLPHRLLGVHPQQHELAKHEIESTEAKGQRLRIRADPAWSGDRPRSFVHRVEMMVDGDRPAAAAAMQLAGRLTVASAQIEHALSSRNPSAAQQTRSRRTKPLVLDCQKIA